jgi:ribokinase
VPRIVVVGSANVDFTVAAPRLPGPGETVSGGTLFVNHGGKGANQAVAARRLGAAVSFVGCVGDDESGRGIERALRAEGVDTTGLARTQAAATGTALIVVDAAGRNQIAVAPGANARLGVDDARRADLADATVVVCQLETPLPTVRWVLEEARRRGAVTLLNPAPVPPQPVSFWELADYVTPNAHEAERLTGVTAADPDAAVHAAVRLRELGAGAAIVTLGEQGALVAGRDATRHIAGFAVPVVDTTAAGDAFNGALAVALTERRALPEAVRFAHAAAALACTRRGAQAALPSRAEVEALLRRGQA